MNNCRICSGEHDSELCPELWGFWSDLSEYYHQLGHPEHEEEMIDSSLARWLEMKSDFQPLEIELFVPRFFEVMDEENKRMLKDPENYVRRTCLTQPV